MSQLAVIAGITWLAVVSPGPDFVMIARNSALYGRVAGIAAAAGIAVGVQVHVLFAIFGLVLVEMHAPAFLGAVQLAGAAFLVFLGIRTMRAGALVDSALAAAARQHVVASLLTGFATNALNYKTLLFVVALFSQVVGTSAGVGEKLIIGSFVSASHFVWFAFVSVFLTSAPARAVVVEHAQLINRVLGAALVAFGAAVVGAFLGAW